MLICDRIPSAAREAEQTHAWRIESPTWRGGADTKRTRRQPHRQLIASQHEGADMAKPSAAHV
eukprot:6177776-Pleurochrysis_carterae.AAC.4